MLAHPVSRRTTEDTATHLDKVMPLSQLVESFKFWDVVALWAKEQLDHEEVVARALAKAVICDGLRLNSVDKRR